MAASGRCKVVDRVFGASGVGKWLAGNRSGDARGVVRCGRVLSIDGVRSGARPLGPLRLEHLYSIAFEPDATCGEHAQYVRIGFLFNFEDSFAEGVGRVVVEDWHWLLPDDGAVVIFVVDEMHGAAA